VLIRSKVISFPSSSSGFSYSESKRERDCSTTTKKCLQLVLIRLLLPKSNQIETTNEKETNKQRFRLLMIVLNYDRFRKSIEIANTIDVRDGSMDPSEK